MSDSERGFAKTYVIEENIHGLGEGDIIMKIKQARLKNNLWKIKILCKKKISLFFRLVKKMYIIPYFI
ncbi:hypothetical protein LLT5_13545 [Lactococcus cremoris subsp. cremoris TIFN5]|nr:hypothetical protein LLT5_01075 [Lactococcus cremoris subsp. cremoris TIFN5]EQC55390.1 hypothetical protein LLT5_13545 [Lactococcus cremoris subsp. cremoris TIFN5]